MSINTLISNKVILAELKSALDIIDDKGVESVTAGAGLAISGSASSPQVDLSDNLLPLADYTIPSLNSADIGKVLSLADADGNMSFISDTFAPYLMPTASGEEGQILALGSEANQLVWAVDASGGQIETIVGENGIVATQDATGTSVNLQLDAKLQPLLSYQTMPTYDVADVGKVFSLGAEGAISWQIDSAGTDSFSPYAMPTLDAGNVGKLLKQNTADGVCSFVDSAGDTDSFAPFSMPASVVAGDVNKVLKLSNDTGLCEWVSDSAGGAVDSVVAGDFINVDVTDPVNPVVKVDVGMPSSNGQILSSTTAGVLSWVDDSGGADYYPEPIAVVGPDQITITETAVGKVYDVINIGLEVNSAAGSATDSNWNIVGYTTFPPVVGQQFTSTATYVKWTLEEAFESTGTYDDLPTTATLANLTTYQSNLIIVAAIGTLTLADWQLLDPTLAAPPAVGYVFNLPAVAPTLSVNDMVFKLLEPYLILNTGVSYTIGTANVGMDWTQFGASDNNAGTTFTMSSVPTAVDYKSTTIATIPFNTDVILNETGIIDETNSIIEVAVPSTKPSGISYYMVGNNTDVVNIINLNITAATDADLPAGMVYFFVGRNIAAGAEVQINYNLNGAGAVGLCVVEDYETHIVQIGSTIASPAVAF